MPVHIIAPSPAAVVLPTSNYGMTSITIIFCVAMAFAWTTRRSVPTGAKSSPS